jgi:Rieske 2Fe-2S family protein
MLPRSAYVDPPVFDWERQYLFGGWYCLGRARDLLPVKGLRAVSVGDSGVLLSRDTDGMLRAFENACRHRGHELLPCGASADSRAIVCPYHAWAYDFDGTLRGAPGFQAVDLDPAEFGLVTMPAVDWHGWLFVDKSGSAEPFTDHVGDLAAIVAPYDAGMLVTAESHEYDVAANWKVVVENFQECYHCSLIHPELCRVSPPNSGENLEPHGAWFGGWMDLRPGVQTMSLDGRSKGGTLGSLGEEQRRKVMYAVVLPNALISLHPDYVMTHVLTPLATDLTRVHCSWAFPGESIDRPDFDPSYAVDFWDLTNRQDWAACESVQRGMNTPHFTPGPLAPAEDGVHQFVTAIARAYQGRR